MYTSKIVFLFRKLRLLNNFLFIGISEDHRKMQYSLEFITDQQKKETKAYHITDIEEWKKSLYVYPVSEGINPLKESLEKESPQTD